MTDDEVRREVAWLLWCVDQGYLNAEDRAILTNHFLEDPAVMHPDDARTRQHWLALADQVIELVRSADGGTPQ